MFRRFFNEILICLVTPVRSTIMMALGFADTMKHKQIRITSLAKQMFIATEWLLDTRGHWTFIRNGNEKPSGSIRDDSSDLVESPLKMIAKRRLRDRKLKLRFRLKRIGLSAGHLIVISGGG